MISYRLATAGDRETIRALLDAERLPSSDLATSGVVLIAAKTQDRLVGCIGIEPHGDAGIIRSLAVAPEFRGRRIARALVSHAEVLASKGGMQCLYLLTEGAAEFWSKIGYVTVSRTEPPPAVRASAEFASLCSLSATCMKHLLGTLDMDQHHVTAET
jgi:N-acetylglutamate synthase-like GNAT family acetyltransferase